MKHIILYIIIGITLLSCSERQEYIEKLEQAQSLLDEHPDSALQILDSLSLHEQDFSKSFRMKYQLLKLQAQNKAFVDFNSDSIAKDLVNYYDRNGNANEKMMSHYLLGCAYRDLGEAPKAVDCYLEAINKADTTKSDCDFYTLSAVYSQMAYMYHKQLLLSREVESQKKASHFALKADMAFWAIYNIDKSSGAYILMNKKDSAEFVIKEAIRLYKKFGYEKHALLTSINLLGVYLNDSAKLAETKQIIDNFDNEPSFFDTQHNLPASKRIYYFYKGKYFCLTNNLDSAEYYFRKMHYVGMPLTSYDAMYHGLLEVYSKRHLVDSILKYSRLYCEVNDSSIAIKDKEITAQMSAIYNYNRYQKEAHSNEVKANKTKMAFLVLISLVIISTIAIGNRYQKLKNKKKQEIESLKAKYISITNEYNNNLQTLQLIDASHQEEIMSIQKENEILKSKIDVLKHKEGIQEQINKTKELRETNIAKRIIYLINHPTICMTEKEWEQLADTASVYYPDLLHDLNKTPKVTQQEMRTCILLCFSLRESDIAHLLNTSAQRITNAKSTINMKLFGDNSARSLYKNLSSNYNMYSL